MQIPEQVPLGERVPRPYQGKPEETLPIFALGRRDTKLGHNKSAQHVVQSPESRENKKWIANEKLARATTPFPSEPAPEENPDEAAEGAAVRMKFVGFGWDDGCLTTAHSDGRAKAR